MMKYGSGVEEFQERTRTEEPFSHSTMINSYPSIHSTLHHPVRRTISLKMAMAVGAKMVVYTEREKALEDDLFLCQ
jgi:hypothetical protein